MHLIRQICVKTWEIKNIILSNLWCYFTFVSHQSSFISTRTSVTPSMQTTTTCCASTKSRVHTTMWISVSVLSSLFELTYSVNSRKSVARKPYLTTGVAGSSTWPRTQMWCGQIQPFMNFTLRNDYSIDDTRMRPDLLLSHTRFVYTIMYYITVFLFYCFCAGSNGQTLHVKTKMLLSLKSWCYLWIIISNVWSHKLYSDERRHNRCSAAPIIVFS